MVFVVQTVNPSLQTSYDRMVAGSKLKAVVKQIGRDISALFPKDLIDNIDIQLLVLDNMNCTIVLKSISGQTVRLDLDHLGKGALDGINATIKSVNPHSFLVHDEIINKIQSGQGSNMSFLGDNDDNDGNIKEIVEFILAIFEGTAKEYLDYP